MLTTLEPINSFHILSRVFKLKCVKLGSDYKDEIYELLARTRKANIEIRGVSLVTSSYLTTQDGLDSYAFLYSLMLAK